MKKNPIQAESVYFAPYKTVMFSDDKPVKQTRAPKRISKKDLEAAPF